MSEWVNLLSKTLYAVVFPLLSTVIFVLQVYKRFVQIGRVALINAGADEGKLCVIVDIIDQNRVRNCVDLNLHIVASAHGCQHFRNNEIFKVEVACWP